MDANFGARNKEINIATTMKIFVTTISPQALTILFLSNFTALNNRFFVKNTQTAMTVKKQRSTRTPTIPLNLKEMIIIHNSLIQSMYAIATMNINPISRGICLMLNDSTVTPPGAPIIAFS